MLNHRTPDAHPADLLWPAAAVLSLLEELIAGGPPGRTLDLSEPATYGLGQLLACLAETVDHAAHTLSERSAA